jgi:hypothetical protein
MSETTPTPTPVRTFTVTSPVKACRLRRDDLARLYRIINERQIESGQILLNQLSQQPEESPEQFQHRRARVADAFVTTVNVTGVNNEIVSGSGEHFLASENIPENILTVFYTTLAGPNAMGIAREVQRFFSTSPDRLSVILANFQRWQHRILALLRYFHHQNPGSRSLIPD